MNSMTTSIPIARVAPERPVAACPAVATACTPPEATLRSLCIAHRWRLALTYALFVVENTVELAQPWVLGLTITALLDGRASLLPVFAGFSLARTALGVSRRMYDTRTFLKVYCALVTQVVVRQRVRNVPTTCIAARATLSRELTDFLERDLPVAVSTGFSVVGSVVLLAVYDPLLSGLACALGVGGLVLNSFFGRRSTALSRELHDAYEREVDVISRGTTAVTQAHYDQVAYREIRISDWQAAAFSATQAIVLGLLVLSLLRSADWGHHSIGDVYAVFRYVTMFAMGITSLPAMTLRVSRLRDIRRRLQHSDQPAG
jgi:hypothetical protein